MSGERCHYCQRVLKPRGGRWASWDHVIPRSRGGADNQSNLVLSCRRCNELKGALTETEFRAAWPDFALMPANISIAIATQRRELARLAKIAGISGTDTGNGH